MSESWNIAVVGATGEVGKAVLSLLEDSDLSLGQVYAVASARSEEETLMFRSKPLIIDNLDDFDFSSVAIAVFAVPSDIALQYVPRALEAGCRVIDHSPAFRRHAEARLVVKGLNDEYLDEGQGNLFVCADATVAILAPLLAALDQAAGLSRVQMTVLQAVSAKGRKGLRELAKQTGELLNARGIDAEVFPQQVAFNLLPLTGEVDPDGRSSDELLVGNELALLLGRPDLPIEVSIVTVPVFYGHGISLYVETQDQLPALAAAEQLSGVADVRLQEVNEDQGVATPVTDAAGQDAVYVSRLRDAVSLPQGLHAWIVADNVRQGAASHSVQIIKKVIKDFDY